MQRGDIYIAPDKVGSWDKTVFLAGTIDMGDSEDWQAVTAELLARQGWNVLNPRRKVWDVSWEQSINNPKFKEQVEWELEGIERSFEVFFNFLPNSKSPVTMAELGYILGRDSDRFGSSAWVCCPKSFYRRGNIEIMCEREGIVVFDTMEELLEEFFA